MTAESKENRTPKGTSPNEVLDATSFLFGTNAAFIEGLYAQYLSDPNSVDGTWRAFFEALGDRGLNPTQLGRGPSWRRDTKLRTETSDFLSALTGDPGPAPKKPVATPIPPAAHPEAAEAEPQASIRAIQLVRAFRVIGHLEANLDPLGLEKRKALPQLQPSFYGFHETDLDRPIFIDGVTMGMETATPRQLDQILRRIYCGSIGYEFMHINDPEQRDWLQRRIEGTDKAISFTPQGKRAILNKLIEAEAFEKFCAVKFVGTKRFGLDGGESMIPGMEQIIKRGGQLGVKDIVLGMPHRGRLNVLANVMAKPYRQLFHEFQGGSAKPSDVQGSGDVKYHLGASSDRAFDGNNVHLSLTANPSHLEAVDPVVLGKSRAK
jgi:2-oxoglutarate dehydrogenase E1 component